MSHPCNTPVTPQLYQLESDEWLTASVALSCSGHTPAGMSVLGAYLGSMPPLPALVLTHLSSGPDVYQYPSNHPIVAPSVLQWLQRVEEGAESPAGKNESSGSVQGNDSVGSTSTSTKYGSGSGSVSF